MKINIALPEPLRHRQFAFYAEELRPSAIEELIEILEEADPADPRIKYLKLLHDELQT